MSKINVIRSVFLAGIITFAVPLAANAESIGGGAPLTSQTTTLKESIGGGAPAQSTETTETLKESIGGGLTAEKTGYFDWFLTLFF